MREKLIELMRNARRLFWLDRLNCDFFGFVADHLIANGVIISKMETVATDNNVGSKLPILCQNCSNHTDVACPENKVWCRKLRRYMNTDAYCSYGERIDGK